MMAGGPESATLGGGAALGGVSDVATTFSFGSGMIPGGPPRFVTGAWPFGVQGCCTGVGGALLIGVLSMGVFSVGGMEGGIAGGIEGGVMFGCCWITGGVGGGGSKPGALCTWPTVPGLMAGGVNAATLTPPFPTTSAVITVTFPAT